VKFLQRHCRLIDCNCHAADVPFEFANPSRYGRGTLAGHARETREIPPRTPRYMAPSVIRAHKPPGGSDHERRSRKPGCRRKFLQKCVDQAGFVMPLMYGEALPE